MWYVLIYRGSVVYLSQDRILIIQKAAQLAFLLYGDTFEQIKGNRIISFIPHRLYIDLEGNGPEVIIEEAHPESTKAYIDALLSAEMTKER